MKVLLLEDSALDAELVTEALSGTGLPCEIRNVVSAAPFMEAIQGETWDLVLADYVLPDFDGLSALRVAREAAPETPFIFVSGTLGEEIAIEALKRGATDYVLKQRLERLPATVLRALAEARAREERRRAEEASRDLLEQRTALLHELDHRVKNNLQLLLSLLSIEIRQADRAEARAALTRVKERVQALATAHRDLYDGLGASRFDAATFTRELFIEHTSHPDRQHVVAEFDVETVEVASSLAAPMALLFNELIMNALSHGYQDRHGRLTLRMRAHEGRLLFELADGAFSPVEKEAARDSSTGTVLTALSRQLHASVEWPQDDGATLVRVDVPLQATGASS
ncbi:sensor histidine kinase [Microvirga antarctica]|uniref:sensor histidine kinase n=1 Tax=Microvirga antarctica TaxID=2819233 RepID=UPI001FE8D186|nr:histidine kinase dimerization/phosphoacceptor domain -containing protein [Microvirga antarctica]